jgi:hypothetical protein
MYHDEKEFAGLVTVNLTPKGDNRNHFCCRSINWVRIV